MSAGRNITVWPDTHRAQIKEAHAISLLFADAEARGDAADMKRLALAEDPDVLRADAERYARHCLNGEFAMVRPTLRLIGRRYDHFIVMENIPDSRRGQIETATVLGVLLALPWIESYWLANEVWRATINATTPATVRKQLPRERADRTEGVVMVIATRAGHHAVRSYATERGDVVGIRYEYDLNRVNNPVLANLFGMRSAVIRLAEERAEQAMSVVGGTPWEPVEPTARMMCMVMRIAQMEPADGCACLTLAYAMWLEGDPHMTPDLARRLFEASAGLVPDAFETLRRARDAENR